MPSLKSHQQLVSVLKLVVVMLLHRLRQSPLPSQCISIYPQNGDVHKESFVMLKQYFLVIFFVVVLLRLFVLVVLMMKLKVV